MKAQAYFGQFSQIVQRVISCLDINFHEERILGTLVKWVIICLDINFHEERILNILVKGNRLLLLIKSCLAVKIQFS
ncbi:uncharacterized protein OCT59_026990 [Rhizophagus irregularis]|uniref:uncharacterized protein n=1 Tax=Rhizophagus irregularis TaxID=588596 RepID=UPI00332A0469|nr:hypothetical protein OCT59_026990 [Rhizophagus irregularis]